MRFEWDFQKARANFGEATEVFDDLNLVENVDDEHSSDETRFVLIGYSTRRMLFVVFVERHGDAIHIISARPPTPTERKLYEERR